MIITTIITSIITIITIVISKNLPDAITLLPLLTVPNTSFALVKVLWLFLYLDFCWWVR